MRTNSRIGTYAYANPTIARHVSSSVTPASGPAQTLVYDLNGNQTAGLDGKVMTYDGENRPLTVSYAGKTTTYVYGADGARLKKIESDPVNGTSVTLYLGAVEIRKYGQGVAEEFLLYPQPNIRITRTKSGGTVTTQVNALHVDGLGSVRAVTGATGAAVERTSFRPYGEEVALQQPLTLPETKGFIGERYDDASGLQYLNTRYYDPKLGLFIQPDWWEVTKPGVGTNRYSYSFNDPVNGKDPGGNDIDDDPRDKSLDSTEYDRARGQEGQSVDEAWGRAENDAAIEAAAEELFGKSFDELNGIEQAAATMLGAAKNGLLGHGAQMVANSDPLANGPQPPARAPVGKTGIDKLLQNLGVKPSAKQGPIWSGTARLTPSQNALSHWKKHKGEFPEYENAVQYVNGAKEFVNSPPTGTKSVVRRNGGTMYYNERTNTFAVVNSEGSIRTMFRPGSGASYWENELGRLR